uniref:Ribonuclease P protein subunit p30 n=1 Tax=Panagrolaimus sp. JU765 TaxID=591449 RepID=A0AC34R538_9BILA
MPHRILRPHISSAIRFDFHAKDNVNKAQEVADFLVKSGKVRQDLLQKQSDQQPSTSDHLMTIGLKQTLKLFRQKKLKWIVLDSKVLTPSAVAHIFGLVATSSVVENTLFYSFTTLSSVLSTKLKLPRVSAVGFGPDCPLDSLFESCRPIEMPSNERKPNEKKEAFNKPKVKVPKGKASNGPSKKTLQKKRARTTQKWKFV